MPEDRSNRTPGAGSRPDLSRAADRATKAVEKTGAAKPKSPADAAVGFGEIDLGESAESLPLAKSATAKPAAAKPAAKKPSLLQDFEWEDDGNSEDLGLATDAAPKSEPKPQPARPAAPAAGQPAGRPRPAAPNAVEQPAPSAPKKPAARGIHPAREKMLQAPPPPKRSYKREITIGAIVLAALAVVGGAIWGFVKWRASVAEQKAAEMRALDQSSLDAMKNQALRKDPASP